MISIRIYPHCGWIHARRGRFHLVLVEETVITLECLELNGERKRSKKTDIDE